MTEVSRAVGEGQPKPVLPASTQNVQTTTWRQGLPAAGHRAVPEETAVAFSYNRVSHAVMMATPLDLRDFAIGFSLSEGVVGTMADIQELDVVASVNGVELRMWVEPACMERLAARRRSAAGPTGCGLCGLDSLEQAVRPTPRVHSTIRLAADDIHAAAALLEPAQALNRLTRAVHAAGFIAPGGNLVALREDVGRHNALDKLAGALASAGVDAGSGTVVMTSRISVELVQKLAAMGAAVLVAMSAPTALALRVAEQAGITIVGVARADGFEVFTRPDRIGSTVSHRNG